MDEMLNRPTKRNSDKARTKKKNKNNKTTTSNYIAESNKRNETVTSNQITKLPHMPLLDDETDTSNQITILPHMPLLDNVQNAQNNVAVSTAAQENISIGNQINSISSIQERNVELEEFTLLPYSSALLEFDESSYLKVPSFAYDRPKDLFFHFFGRVCRRFMYGKCPNNSNTCELDHRLPEKRLFRHELEKFHTAEVIKMYDIFILRNQNLFDTYFNDFIDFLAKNNAYTKLCETVNDCIVRSKQKFFGKIIDGLIQCGIEFPNALQMLIQAIKYRSKETGKIIITLILDSRNRKVTSFLPILESLVSEPNFEFKIEWINRLSRINIYKQNEKLSSILAKIMKKNNFKNVEILKLMKRNGRLMFIIKAINKKTEFVVDSTIANVIYTTAVISFYEKNVKWI